MKAKVIFGIAGLIVAGMAYGSATDLVQGYQDAGGGPFSAAAGGAGGYGGPLLWAFWPVGRIGGAGTDLEPDPVH